MAGENPVQMDTADAKLEQSSTSSTPDEKTNDSDSTINAGRVTETEELDQGDAHYESIRPATAASLAHSHTNKSTCSARSVARIRSQNGHGCDDAFHDEDDDEIGNSSASDDPEAGRVPHQKEKDEFEVAFDKGSADPWNPRTMATPRKWVIVTITSAGSFCVTCASSIYASTYTQMDAEFDCSHLVATLGLSTFVLGIALGPMWSPLSEFYGRRPIYLAAFAMFTIWIIPTAVAKNITTVIISRFFQGLSGSAFLSVSGGTVSDLFTPDKMQHPMTMFTAAPFLGPCVGPLIGGFINSNVSWRWTHYVLIIWALTMFVGIFFLIPETYRESSPARLGKSGAFC